jgi:hypothetical protein
MSSGVKMSESACAIRQARNPTDPLANWNCALGSSAPLLAALST